jgi:hypothetical protein
MDDRSIETEVQEPVATSGVELGRISAEIQSVSAGFQAQLLQALAEMREAMEREFNSRLEQETEAVRAGLLLQSADGTKEIDRITAQLDAISSEISAMVDDPDVELSLIMRKKAEESILRAYLDGLKFSLGLPSSSY